MKDEPKKCGICGLSDIYIGFSWINIPEKNKAISACTWCACELLNQIMDTFENKAKTKEILLNRISEMVIERHSVEIVD